jgi:FkbM family methyltransferase
MYSQNNEEQIILDYFKDKPKGILLDIGANDGVTFSNSRALIESGWKAVLAEPSPVCVKKLLALYQGNESVVVAPFAIVSSEMAEANESLILHESGPLISEGDHGLVSTIIESEKERFPAVNYSPVEVQGLSYSDFVSLGSVDIFRFISIDAEGLDYAILSQIDLSLTDMVCVEYNGIDPEKYIAYCAGFGLKEIHRNGENLIFAR